MTRIPITVAHGRLISGGRLLAWRTAQIVVWAVGAAILGALIFVPSYGLHAFWNVLIPVAPALFAFVPGVWRNLCPLGSSALFARHIGRSRATKLPLVWQGRLALAAVMLLFLIVPLRHVVLDLSGLGTAITILLLATVAVSMGLLFDWKSGWCSGLCPVHPVEKLYGLAPLLTVPNAHCEPCGQCVSPCTDATPVLMTRDMYPPGTRRPPALARSLMVGGFGGFIWGWFQVPDYAGVEGWAHLGVAYGLPFAGLSTTWALFLFLQRIVPGHWQHRLLRGFAAAAIACYYWYRLPALFGFGRFPGDGMLVDLSGTLPPWFPTACRVATTLLFGWWLVGRSHTDRSWQIRAAVGSEVAEAGPQHQIGPLQHIS